MGDARAHPTASAEGEYHPRRGGGSAMLAQGVLVHAVPQDACRAAEEGTTLILTRFPTWKVWGSSVEDAAPAAAIVGKAKEWRANMVVVGAHGASALERLVLGSVSQRSSATPPVRFASAAAPLPATLSVGARTASCWAPSATARSISSSSTASPQPWRHKHNARQKSCDN